MSQPTSRTGKAFQVLVVEDYEPNALVTLSLLQELGYEGDLASDGEEALRRLSSRPYDIVIMDIQLPGIDGLEVTRRLRVLEETAGRPPAPVLALSARATEDDRLLCMKAGMNDCLSKPFRLVELQAKMDTLLAGVSSS